MAVLVAGVHVAFALYFLVRLLTVTPFLPQSHLVHPAIPFVRLLLLGLAPLLPVALIHASFNLPLLASYGLALTAALRFAVDAPLLSFADPIALPHHPRLLLWRVDVLAYLLFVCATALSLSPLAALLYSVLAAAATVATLTDLYARARQQHASPSLLHLVRLAFRRATPPVAPVPAPPTIHNASAFALLSFEWVTPTVATGRVRSLEADDVMPLADGFSCYTAAKTRFDPFWRQELQASPPANPSLFRALFRAFGLRLMIGGSLKLVNDVCIFISPMLLRLIIMHLQNRDQGLDTPWQGFFLAVALFATYLLQTMVFNQYFNVVSTVQVLLRGALISAVFNKSTKLSPESRGLYTSGQIQNLMSTDSRTVADVVLYVHMLWSSLEQICVALALLVQLLGWVPTMAGVMFIIASLPLQAHLVAAVKRLREHASYKTDERVKVVSEAIKGIKLVKLYAWELSFVKRILEVRALELDYLRKMALTQSWNSVMMTSLPTVLTIIAFGAYALTGRALNAAVVFPAIALFNVIRPPLLFFPYTLINSARAAASLARLKKFLAAEELTPLNEGDHAVDQELMELNGIDLAAINASFTWDPSISMSSPTISSVSFQIPEGALVAVVGPTGSGKSTLLAGLLGELPIVSGKAGIRNGRTVSFCDQVPFIQNATVRENILFGKPFEEEHYWTTIRVCSLQSDLDILPAGDMTEIGGRGVNLSGGQRARVSLARAVYSRSDICLLDDPLCAVDAHVGKSIFNDCIVSQLRGKTRVLTTNQIHFAASREVDLVMVVKNGMLVEVGDRDTLLANPRTEFSHLVEAAGELGTGEEPDEEPDEVPHTNVENATASNGQRDETIQGADTIEPQSPGSDKRSNPPSTKEDEASLLLKKSTETDYGAIEAGRLTRKETKNKGRVQLKHYRTYLAAMGVFQWVLPIFVFALGAQIFSLGVNIWLSVWSEQHSTDKTFFNMMVFFALGGGSVFVAACSVFALAYASIRASVFLHEKLLLSVFGAPSSFFNSTPEGRLVNRFNSDMDKVDSTLAPTLQSLLRLVLSLVFTVGLILWATPAFIFVVIPIGAVCLYVQEFYRKTSVDLRRLEALARSPLYSHFGETLDGVVTIRAYGDVPRASHTSDVYTDMLNRTSYATSYANRWISIRLESLGTFLIFGATALAVLSPPGKISASMTGLVLSYTMQILGTMTWSVRQFTEAESQLSAIERVSEYSDPPFAQEETGGLEGFLEEEQSTSNNLTRNESLGLISDQRIAQLNHGVSRRQSRWPRKGEIEFQGVEMRYRHDLEPALKKVSFLIQPGEHVGIVGRTGAGKSSAIQSLFRLYELDQGRIVIDGVDISSLRLFHLRSSLGIIPQEPVCFSGTIRSNLDMFEEHEDSAVQKALGACGLQSTMRQKVTLNFEIAENGSNLSVGQRQLLCLGRALLKDSQILILDEATSSVSNATDEMIQRTLRDEMQHCTIMTVAHRLHTVMGNDRIIVMDKGEIAEIGEPSELLKGPSRLSSLVDETGPATAAHLRYLASLPRNNGSTCSVNGRRTMIEDRTAKVSNGTIMNGCHPPLEQGTLMDNVREAFLELRAALTDVDSQAWRNELTAVNIDESQWRHQLHTMVSRLSVLAEHISPAHNESGSVSSYVVDVPNRSTDMLAEVLQDGGPRLGMPGREQRTSVESLENEFALARTSKSSA